jgi:hypothetical protein
VRVERQLSPAALAGGAFSLMFDKAAPPTTTARGFGPRLHLGTHDQAIVRVRPSAVDGSQYWPVSTMRRP